MGLNTNQHLKIVIDSIDRNIKVDLVTSLGAGKYRLDTTNTKWATYGKTISSLLIDSFVQNQSITVSSNTLPVAGTFVLSQPFFFYGTFTDTSEELKKINSSTNKLPFIYLHLMSPETYSDDEATIDYTSDCAIYFMVDSDPKNWLTGDHYTNAINPMKALIKYFIEALKKYSQLNADNKLTYTENDYVRFGKVEKDIGTVKQIFADNISGTELLIGIPFNKSFICE